MGLDSLISLIVTILRNLSSYFFVLRLIYELHITRKTLFFLCVPNSLKVVNQQKNIWKWMKTKQDPFSHTHSNPTSAKIFQRSWSKQTTILEFVCYETLLLTSDRQIEHRTSANVYIYQLHCINYFYRRKIFFNLIR